MRWCVQTDGKTAIIAVPATAVPKSAASLALVRTNNRRYQRSIVMPSHFLSYDKIIYLLSITSRNKEVDLNYRSGFLWQHFAISLRFSTKIVMAKAFLFFVFSFFSLSLSILSLHSTNNTKGNGGMIKKCQWKIACSAYHAERVLSYYIFFDVNLLPVFGISMLLAYKRNINTSAKISTHTECRVRKNVNLICVGKMSDFTD